jgi:hypothetical protein
MKDNPQVASSERIAAVAALLTSLRETDDPKVPYVPFLTAIRSKSHGYVHRVLGLVTGRMHHLQSRGEYWLLLLLDMAGTYKNLREGFPLPLSLTEPIAESKGIKHPFNRFARENAIMSVDFIATGLDGIWTGIDYKPSAELERKRVKEKLHLTRLALAEVGVEHVVITERDLPPQLIDNLRFLHTFASPIDPPPLPHEILEQAGAAMRAALFDGRFSVYEAAVQFRQNFNCSPAQLVRTAFWLIAHRHWHIDLHHPVHPEKPLIFKESA